MDNRKSALVADDDEYFRLAIRGILKSKLAFTHVHEAGSLQEAVEILEKEPQISFAIFDLRMPGMASAGSLKAVRQEFPSLQLAVVSSSEDRGDILLALETRAHGYVPKGVGLSELTRALQVITEGQIYVPSLLARSDTSQELGSLSEWNLDASQRAFLTLLLQPPGPGEDR